MCWTKTNNKKEHVMCISQLETLGDHKPEISNQVLCEFCAPKNSFHMMPRVLKAYFESLEIAF